MYLSRFILDIASFRWEVVPGRKERGSFSAALPLNQYLRTLTEWNSSSFLYPGSDLWRAMHWRVEVNGGQGKFFSSLAIHISSYHPWVEGNASLGGLLIPTHIRGSSFPLALQFLFPVLCNASNHLLSPLSPAIFPFLLPYPHGTPKSIRPFSIYREFLRKKWVRCRITNRHLWPLHCPRPFIILKAETAILNPSLFQHITDR